jgi:hypothetical protein
MLIAPFEGDFAEALAAAAHDAGWKVALASRSGGVDEGDGSASDSRGTLVPWNPASYVSAGALALTASSTLGEIDVLVLVCDPKTSETSLYDGSAGRLGTAFEAAVTGPLYLAREMIRRFETAKAGRLLLVSAEAEQSTSWSTLVGAAFRGLGETAFARARGATWSAWGLAERSGKVEAAADFALRLLEEQKTAKSGRWLPYNGKSGIFGVF